MARNILVVEDDLNISEMVEMLKTVDGVVSVTQILG